MKPRSRPLAAGTREPGEDERALFRDAVKGVRPLRADTLLLRHPPPRAVPRARPQDPAGTTLHEPSDAELEFSDHLEYRRVGLQPAQWRRLRRGDYAIEDTLDLHGVTVAAARELLAAFLGECVAAGRKCVRIVHGKGLRSPDHTPVLKPRVAYWLAHAREVVAYTSARPADGGTGALYVLLKRER